jgi:hypothetical protein
VTVDDTGFEDGIEHLEGAAAATLVAQAARNPLARTSVHVTADEHAVVDAAARALARHPGLYQRGNLLAHVLYDDTPVAGVLRARAAPRIAPLPPALLRAFSTAVIYWYQMRYDKREKEDEPVQVHPPPWAVAALHERGHWPGVRPLEGIAEAPVLRPDGTIAATPGYDAQTGILVAPTCAFPPVPDRPSADQVRAAVALLREPFEDFPLPSEAHRAALLAAVLTGLARAAIRGPTPLFLLDANVPGAGKSLVADVISEIIAGRPLARMAPTEDDAEMRKRITALAIAGVPHVLLDNVAGALGGPSIDAALTSTTWRDRVLGESRDVELPLTAVWYATGNNVQLAGDLARRVCHARLESPFEHPEERRDFRHPDLLGWVRENRAALVVAGLTVLRAYFVAGAPEKRLPMWGSFEAWTRVVRQALVWAGQADPAETREQLRREADSSEGSHAELVAGWAEVAAGRFGGQCTVAQALQELTRNEIASRNPVSPESLRYETLRSALAQLCGAPPGKLPGTRSVGKVLAKYRGRTIGGRALAHPPIEADRKGALIWLVKRVEAPAVDPEPGADAESAGSAGPAGSQTRHQTRQTEANDPERFGAMPCLPSENPTLHARESEFLSHGVAGNRLGKDGKPGAGVGADDFEPGDAWEPELPPGDEGGVS